MRRRATVSRRLRIIGGKHRGRKLRFPDDPGLRPTPDRVRETLFNWLRPFVPGSRCLDLFSGSGVLGLEALSQGAGRVLFVDTSAAAVQRIRQHLGDLGLEPFADTRCSDALHLLAEPPARPFDIVFADPPYKAGLLPEVVGLLEMGEWLSRGALVYLEQDSHVRWPDWSAGWQLHREGVAGQVAFRLMQWRD